MSDKYKTQFSRTLSRILGHLPENPPAGLEAFVRQFFDKMPIDDIKSLDAAQAFAMAADAFAFIQKRKAGEPKIEVTKLAQEKGRAPRALVRIMNDDMPFLVDSVSAELIRQGFTTYALFHPLIRLTRDAKGTVAAIAEKPGRKEQYQTESFMHIEISTLPEETSAQKLAEDLAAVLRQVRLSVEDWPQILKKAEGVLKKIDKVSPNFKPDEINEVKDFLTWLCDRNFIFLGYIEYDFYDDAGKERLSVVPGSALGVLRARDLQHSPHTLEGLPPEVLHFALIPQLVEITKSNHKSVVHRPVHMDYIGIKRFDAAGRVVGEARFLGMFTSIVYYQSAETIPIIRQKIIRTMARAGFDPGSHDGKGLKTILEFLPRDEIFQMSEDDLFDTSLGILSIEARPAVRLFVRRDAFERFLSCMVFTPRERFSTELRYEIQRILEQAFGGIVTAYYTQVTDSPLARLHLIVKTTPGQIPDTNIEEVEKRIAEVTHLWSDSLLVELNRKHELARAEQLFRDFGNAFPDGYINRNSALSAAEDIDKMSEALAGGALALELFRSKTDDNAIHLKLYNPKAQVPLSDILPMLENMGFRVIDENPFLITRRGGEEIWIRDFRLIPAGEGELSVTEVKASFEEALTKVWAQEMANDRFNALVLLAGLAWREVVLLRAYAKYLKQTGFPYSQEGIQDALLAHPALTRDLLALFYLRCAVSVKFDAASFEAKAKEIEEKLGSVSNLTEDRIIRRFMELIKATLRTNFFQTAEDGKEKPYLSFKFDSAKVPELPLPRPHAEIFVYSRRVEGIHLRGGKVARGGLRWSDRHEDFRTEVLGLMKAQMVKNAVIVPVGSKGGFVVKRPPQGGTREALLEEGIFCYKMYLCGLLDLTDNIVGGKIVPPKHVMRHDGDDPYLVVAADKGTATFSDIANSVSKEYGFWLGDAFASGGSVGYDHKKMGITAKGGWISVTRHFQEMGVDIARADFTCVGIGDMAGDVFGNGMLLSEHIKLVGAFNHQHIFLDPNPDAKKSFAERKRLFDLPRSSWKDYDAKLISKGGGIFERAAKTIKLSAEIRAVIGVESESLTPDELIRALLLAPVDLLWNGGIGTYVKSEFESHEQVGDRANNALRVNGKDLRCKIVGEGGNLGFTQKGRIEYARQGGRINTDAIDNSAGVDCSDHEVNIKIALGRTVAEKRLTVAKRDELLASMTDEVGYLVLRDNFLQTQALTVAQLQGVSQLDAQARLMKKLERAGLLDRAIESLPTEKSISELKAARKGLTRPELAVLLAYSKMSLYQQILDSDLPDDPYFTADLIRYFPKAMREAYASDIEAHRLRREIIATVMTNSMVNRAGITFFQGLAEDTGLALADIARAYTVVRDAFSLRKLWADIEALGAEVNAEARMALFTEIHHFLERMTLWFLRHCPLPLDIASIMKEFVPGIETFTKHCHEVLSGPMEKAYRKRFDAITGGGVPEALAQRVAQLEALASSCDIVKVANAAGQEIVATARMYFTLGAELSLGWLRKIAADLTPESHWHRLALTSLIDDFYDQQRRFAANVIGSLSKEERKSGNTARWFEEHADELARYRLFLTDLKAAAPLDVPMLIVASRQVQSLIQA